MLVFYYCSHCHCLIDKIEIAALDEQKLGFDCLTEEERRDIIKIDSQSNITSVQAICDDCYEKLQQTDHFLSVFPGDFIQ